VRFSAVLWLKCITKFINRAIPARITHIRVAPQRTHSQISSEVETELAIRTQWLQWYDSPSLDRLTLEDFGPWIQEHGSSQIGFFDRTTRFVLVPQDLYDRTLRMVYARIIKTYGFFLAHPNMPIFSASAAGFHDRPRE
jgi:hypothetical protein